MKIWTYLVSALAVILVPAFAYAGTVTYYHNDLAGNPVAATNSQGQVIWRESYRPYGERTVNSAAARDNKIWFTSRRQDPETGLVYMGARYYDPVVGRFISTDPLGFDENNAHSFNRYAYANNNPYRYRDPNGAQALPVVTPPPFVATGGGNVLQGKPSEAQVLRGLEGFSAVGSGGFRLPSFDAADAMNFIIGGVPAVTASKLSNLIFSEGAASRGKAPEIAGGIVTESGFLDAAARFLGGNATEMSPGRFVSEDGLHQVRFGRHETKGPLHGHFEAYDKAGGKVIETTTVQIKPDGQ